MARLPTFENSRELQDDPQQKYQWAFVAIKLAGDTEFTPNPEAREWMSQHLEDLGFRHDPELMLKKLRTPHRGQQHYLNNTSEWVGIDEPDVAPVALPNMEEYTRHEQEFVAEQLRYHGVVKDAPVVEVDKASVTVAPVFNPADATVSYVKGYLVHASDQERRRVLAAEMMGKKRQGILNDPSVRGL
ncbi:phage gene 29 protein family protein [Rhodococcoides fascians]|uniref:phage gene 29 protein family protein n=1 Tax=Rhodococcoides fascians TaxID=1828 RepID=UPI0009B92ECF|nr:DUF2744 domain-containing protein [Rhodococcus fascians]